MIKISIIVVFSFCAMYWNSESIAKGVYLEPEIFLDQVFSNNPPKSDKIWITKKIKTDIHNILGHDLGVLRLRFWDDKSKRAWILEEIGRDKPITVGLVTANGKIEQINVLIFRESRGWEVKYPFFTNQYKQASLLTGNQLDRKIDGISGATLSVNAVTKLARLALYLDGQVSKQ
jgi:FMN-binding protein